MKKYKNVLIGLSIFLVLITGSIIFKLPDNYLNSSPSSPSSPSYSISVILPEEQVTETTNEVLSELSEEIFYVTDQLVEAVEVLRYVDGDTIWVKDWEGNEYKVRLIGTVCEESASFDESKNTEGGKLASEYIQSIISIGDTIYLEKDISETDIYDRALRYVWIEYPTSVTDYDEIYNKMLNAIIIREGYGKAAYYKPDVKNYQTFKSIQNEAEENDIGLWESYWQ